MSTQAGSSDVNTDTPSSTGQVPDTKTNYKRELDKAALKAHQKEVEEEEKSHESVIQKGIETGMPRPPMRLHSGSPLTAI
jgi:hypothetical protein